MKPRIIDLFCGAGGFSRGFKESGFNIVFAIDNDPACGKSYKTNFPEAIVLIDDIKNVSGSDITYFTQGKYDVVIGSPPCEPFTGANPNRERDPLDRLYKDPIGRLTLEFIRIVGELKPKVFVMENVPAILDEPIRNSLIYEFQYVGYNQIYFNVLDAEKYGTPSRRRRVFISNVPINPKPVKRLIRVIDALSDLPPPSQSNIPNHEYVPISDKKMKKISRLRHGKALYYYYGDSKVLPNFIKLDPYRIAPTVLGSSRFIHPFENRLLTVREQARLMGYPDDHIFFGGKDQQFNQVGESVPPTLSFAIAKFLMETMFK
ncbi:DNA cytosine methyltransferase [Ignisphaera sp. 4213-co]|uniref:DNA (cytosine-5-)-methyltransferase n=1 Tax=Ignisphaera cupida TaxID=3050454 RepID=A0ABD4Z3Q1_9CREN|nr:DNA cytosine methyltransferase [Ignisphaera sp. 4213-co]MDK6027770.1 DNA cytosine methyltransferase [Ignisphaera sp. 4213-co]